jgi:hypothetical protein
MPCASSAAPTRLLRFRWAARETLANAGAVRGSCTALTLAEVAAEDNDDLKEAL